MAWIAVDVGTSVVKAVAFDDSGREIALAREDAEVIRASADFSEQSMDAVWASVCSTVKSVAERVSEAVRGVAVTAQGDGCWLVDAAGDPTGNAVLWNDGRATGVIERWSASGAILQAFKTSGSIAYPGLMNTIFAWLRENEPQRLASAKFALSCNGWIFSRMTGKFVADLSDASNPFCDVRVREYSPELVELYGAREQRAMLPPIARGKGLVAELRTDAAGELGLPVGTPVVMAPYDIVTTGYGSGMVRPGQACVILGTTICAETLVAELNADAVPAGTTLALEDGLYLRAMPTLTGCETLSWAARMLGVAGIEELEALATEAENGSAGLLFLPYLSPAGERAPFLEPRARGSFHGLTLTHTRAEIARAVYEGLTFAVRECLEAAAPGIGEVRVCGGGARSDFWCQMIADVTGATVMRPDENELGARGAFLFALQVVGVVESVDEAEKKFPLRHDVFEPAGGADVEREFLRFRRTREFARVLWNEEQPG